MADIFNKPAPQALDLLLSRRSGSAKAMTGPGPDAGRLRQILAAGARVPDHGKLTPWRFIIFEGDARTRMGELLVDVLRASESEAGEVRIEMERGRFLRAPVVVAVVSRIVESLKAPEWEQVLSAGAACQNMLIAAHALGYVGNWITEWYAFDRKVLDRLGLAANERIAGYLYFGTAAEPLEERVRPDLDGLITHF
jgi:nitroreductase